MNKFLILLFFLVFSMSAQGADFSMISPGSEGDNESAQVVLQELYSYLKSNTQENWEGEYFNEEKTALERLKTGQIDFAIVSYDFFEKFQKKYNYVEILKTIPVYANGPFETLFLLAGPQTKDFQRPISSQNYSKSLLEKAFPQKTFSEITVTSDILQAIQNVANGTNPQALLMSGYEYSIVQTFRDSNPDFQKLEIFKSSEPLPSAVVVSLETKPEQKEKLKKALLRLSQTGEGKTLLKNLRLKGFQF